MNRYNGTCSAAGTERSRQSMNDEHAINETAPIADDEGARLSGVWHAFVAFDWGDAVDLEIARRLASAQQSGLARRRRTPSSIDYRPAPLRIRLPEVQLNLPGWGRVAATAEATLFDIAAVSVELSVSFERTAAELSRLADWLAEPGPILDAARAVVEPLYAQLLPAIRQPEWSSLSEEYFVFELLPQGTLTKPIESVATHSAWMAGLVKLESATLAEEELSESLRLRISYSPRDLLVAEWAASVLIDSDCEETLQVIEFANVQLLEFRHIDRRLDDRLEQAYQLIYPLARSRWPLFRTQTRQLRALGEMKVEAHGLFERTSNVLKLVGDQYLSRVYRLLAARFHLDAWEKSIRQSLEVAQEVHQVVSDQASHYRTEVLEIVVIILIMVEIIMAVVGH